MGIVLGVFTALIVAVSGLVLFTRLRPFRIDISPNQDAYEGQSMIPQDNYLSRNNYRPEAYPLLRIFWLWHGVWAVTLVGIGWVLLR